jgi:hypothetical protein
LAPAAPQRRQQPSALSRQLPRRPRLDKPSVGLEQVSATALSLLLRLARQRL